MAQAQKASRLSPLMSWQARRERVALYLHRTRVRRANQPQRNGLNVAILRLKRVGSRESLCCFKLGQRALLLHG